MAASGGVGVALDEFGAFVGVVEGGAQALFFEEIAAGMDEIGGGCCAVAVG